MISEALIIRPPGGQKKEKTSNNFLKSPLRGCKQSCSLKGEEEIQSVVVIMNCEDKYRKRTS